MAVHDVDQKILSRLALETAAVEESLSKSLYQLLGLSVMLTRRLRRARRVRKLDITHDSKSLALYQSIIWLSRSGLSITDDIVPKVSTGQYGMMLRIFAEKLRASFFHIFALYHNQPPVTHVTSSSAPRTVAAGSLPKVSPPRARAGNGGERPGSGARHLRSRTATLRDTIPSMNSDTSYVTNPYARGEGTEGEGSLSPPPGLPQPSAFILQSIDFIPLASYSFNFALQLATERLPGSAPLRLTIALEYCAFLWDCLHDHDASRRLATKTIREVYMEQEGMGDAEFEDAAQLVGTLGRMMRRKSNEPTPRMGAPSPGNPGRGGFITPQQQIQATTPRPINLATNASSGARRSSEATVRQGDPQTLDPPSPSRTSRHRIARKAIGSTPSPGRARSTSSSRSVPRKPVPIRKSPPQSPSRGASRGHASTPTRTTASTLVPSPSQTPTAEPWKQIPAAQELEGSSPVATRPTRRA